jgi:hypothetical protein
MACPALKALFHIMRDDHYEGKDISHPEIRALFTRESLLHSDWYQARLAAKREVDTALWKRHVSYLEEFLTRSGYAQEAERLGIEKSLHEARKMLASFTESEPANHQA